MYELLDKPEKWTKRYFARDAFDNPVMINDEHACKFCIYGAIDKCYTNEKEHDKVTDVISNFIKKNYGPRPIAQFNDASTTTYDDIIRMLKELQV